MTELVQRIRNRESEIDELCTNAVAVGMKAVALAFEQGDDLVRVRSSYSQCEFSEWISENFGKGWRTAQKYMKLAAIPKADRKLVLTDAKSLNDAFRTLGIISNEQPELISEPSISIPPEIQRLNWIAQWMPKCEASIMAMNPLARQELKARLSPVVEVYKKL